MRSLWTEFHPAWWFTILMGAIFGLFEFTIVLHYPIISKAFIEWSVKRITMAKNKWLRHIEKGVANEVYFVNCLRKRDACFLCFFGTGLAVWLMGICFFARLPSTARMVLLFTFILTFLLELYFGYSTAYYECLTYAMMKTGNERRRTEAAASEPPISPPEAN